MILTSERELTQYLHTLFLPLNIRASDKTDFYAINPFKYFLYKKHLNNKFNTFLNFFSYIKKFYLDKNLFSTRYKMKKLFSF